MYRLIVFVNAIFLFALPNWTNAGLIYQMSGSVFEASTTSPVSDIFKLDGADFSIRMEFDNTMSVATRPSVSSGETVLWTTIFQAAESTVNFTNRPDGAPDVAVPYLKELLIKSSLAGHATILIRELTGTRTAIQNAIFGPSSRYLVDPFKIEISVPFEPITTLLVLDGLFDVTFGIAGGFALVDRFDGGKYDFQNLSIVTLASQPGLAVPSPPTLSLLSVALLVGCFVARKSVRSTLNS